MEFSKILTDLRAERGVYQKVLASYLNVSIGTISNYEKGIHSPDFDTLCKIADYFGVTTDYLLGRTNYRYNPEMLNHKLIKDYTVADLINTTMELDFDDLESMMDYLDLLKVRSMQNLAKQQEK